MALNEDEKRIRFASCKRSPEKLLVDVANFGGHVGRFLAAFPRYQDWKVEKIGVAPTMSEAQRKVLQVSGIIPESLEDLIKPFRRAT